MDDTVAEQLRLLDLGVQLDGARCRLRASESLKTMQGQQPPGLEANVMDALSLSAGADSRHARAPGTLVLDNLSAYASTALSSSGVRSELMLVKFPLPFEPAPCKPLLFDVARNSIRLPNLSAFRKQERRGLFGRIWGR
jgi:hypothetical protein